MAFFMLVSTVSWTVEKHFCFGSLVDIAFFHEADTCGMDLGLVVEDVSSKNNPNTCCSDETILVQGQDDLSISYDDLSFGQQQFLVAFTSSYIKLFQPREQHYVPHADYPPPILVRDIHILDQVFLI